MPFERVRMYRSSSDRALAVDIKAPLSDVLATAEEHFARLLTSAFSEPNISVVAVEFRGVQKGRDDTFSLTIECTSFQTDPAEESIYDNWRWKGVSAETALWFRRTETK